MGFVLGSSSIPTDEPVERVRREVLDHDVSGFRKLMETARPAGFFRSTQRLRLPALRRLNCMASTPLRPLDVANAGVPFQVGVDACLRRPGHRKASLAAGRPQ